MGKVLLERKDVDENLTWDLKSIYKTEEDFEQAVKEAEELSIELEREYKGKLKDSNIVNSCLDKLRTLYELSNVTEFYSYFSISVDQSNIENQTRQMKLSSISSRIQSRISFVKSEIMELDEDVIMKAIETSNENKNYLKNIIRSKKYALHPEVEKALSSLSNTLNAPFEIYNRAKLVDMDFGTFTVDDKEYPLSFGLFEGEWEYENDTKLRHAAFEAFSKKLREYNHTIAATYQTHVQKNKTMATLRGFESVFDFLLFDHKVDQELYNRQIDLIMEHLAPHMRKFAKLLQKIHGLDEMTFSDLKLEVDPEFEPKITVEESREYVEGALSVLGDNYLDLVKRAYDERWVDFVQNKGKSTGAFSYSPYGSHPFVLISWTNRMREVFVLAHELGHAGHYYLSQQNQNIFDYLASTYFLEAPSTMNEMLMANYLMKNTNDKRLKRWALSSVVSRTYYHNFVTHLLEAHYQREVYRIIDKGGSVQAETLNRLKRETLEKFWGNSVRINEGAELTWMRQPHYYKGLHSYNYSAGLTIATEVSKRVLNEGQSALDDWMEVLKAGGTKSPIELAQMAGVDITTETPLLNTIEHIGNLIDEIIKLSEELEE
ncbi:MAG TPA: oligoendopeptidase F [Clostridiales bacterium]|nr:oligoendopeptidase F [Clostridiales bacterium]